MTLTFAQARDEILTLFKTAWDATGHEAFYEDVKKQRDNTQDPWAWVILRHATGGQTALNGNAGERMFSRLGFVQVSVYTAIGGGLQDSYDLAKVVADAYEGASTSGGVWFRNVRINEIGRDGEFFIVNVIVDFEYDEVK